MRSFILVSLLVLSTSACIHSEKNTSTETPAGQPQATTPPAPATSTTPETPANAQATKKTTAPAAPVQASAQANLKSIQGQLKGVVHFTQSGDKIKVTAMVEGMKAGPHGFFLQEKNLGNIIVDSKGKGKITTEISDMHMNPTPEDKKSIIGKTIWIYAGPSFKGAKIASGIVESLVK